METKIKENREFLPERSARVISDFVTQVLGFQ